MASWGISEKANGINKIKSESADYLHGLNACGIIDWETYSKLFDFYEVLLEKAYQHGLHLGDNDYLDAEIRNLEAETRLKKAMVEKIKAETELLQAKLSNV